MIFKLVIIKWISMLFESVAFFSIGLFHLIWIMTENIIRRNYLNNMHLNLINKF